MSLSTLFRHYLSPLRSSDGRIRYYNFWNRQAPDDIWFTAFLHSRGFLERFPRACFVFFSSLGSINVLRLDTLMHPFSRNRKRIYFNGENNHYPGFASYLNNLLDYRAVDLSMGFDDVKHPRYLRFPLWLLEMFPPDLSVDDIHRICDRLSHQHWDPSLRNRFCALVSGNRGPDDPGAQMRTRIVKSLTHIDAVDCAGKLLHNTDELKVRFGDNKAEYLKQYRFYICPENASVEGYVTEKVFHCIGSGCIPIYWGANGDPEPDVLNQDAILFWEKDSDNEALLGKVQELYDNEQLYREFFEQPRLKEGAWEVVTDYFFALERKLNELFK